MKDMICKILTCLMIAGTICPLNASMFITRTISVNSNTNSCSSLTISDNPYRYGSYYTDEESGLAYCNARYYSPELMTFNTRDSYDVANRYGYCDNNPVMYADPDGHSPFEILKRAGRKICSMLCCCRRTTVERVSERTGQELQSVAISTSPSCSPFDRDSVTPASLNTPVYRGSPAPPVAPSPVDTHASELPLSRGFDGPDELHQEQDDDSVASLDLMYLPRAKHCIFSVNPNRKDALERLLMKAPRCIMSRYIMVWVFGEIQITYIPRNNLEVHVFGPSGDEFDYHRRKIYKSLFR